DTTSLKIQFGIGHLHLLCLTKVPVSGIEQKRIGFSLRLVLCPPAQNIDQSQLLWIGLIRSGLHMLPQEMKIRDNVPLLTFPVYRVRENRGFWSHNRK